MPPKPKLLLSTALTSRFLATCGTRSTPSVPSLGIVEIERRRHDLVADRQDAEDALDRTGATEQMPDRRFGARHRRTGQIVAEHALGCGELDRVGHRRGAVGVDVIDVGRLHPGLAQRHAHREFGALAFGMRRGDVVGIAREAVADDLGIDLRATRLGVLVFLEHDDPGAFAHHEAVAVLVIRSARLGRTIVHAHVERAGLRETPPRRAG